MDSSRVLGSMVPAAGLYLNHFQAAGISAQGLVSRLYFYRHIGAGLVGSGGSTVPATGGDSWLNVWFSLLAGW